MELLLNYSFRFVQYVMFGFSLEIFVVAYSKVLDGRISGRDKYLEGKTYLWMIPVYGLLLLFVFEPMYKLIALWPSYCRFIVWALSFTFFEGLSGYLYDKLLGFCPWDYSKSKYKVCKRGYTKYTLIPAWGVAGLIIEKFSDLIQFLSVFAAQYYLSYLLIQ